MTDLAIVIPTLNERENIRPLLDRLSRVLAGISWEVVFVDDDSSDGTADFVRQISRSSPHVRVIQRIGRRGLSSACIEGMLATSTPYVAVMDADLQHDESLLPRMLAELKGGEWDIVVASRHVDGGSVGDFSRRRVFISDVGRKISSAVCKCSIQDPMSGFFMLDRSFLDETVHELSSISFKILVDLLSSSRRPVRMKELPYHFGSRLYGESKLDTNALLEYLLLVADKTIGRFVPVRFVMFGLAGFMGVAVHLALLSILFLGRHTSFLTAQATATIAAMTVNYVVNNEVTYRDRRRRGLRFWKGLLLFELACSLGAVSNFAIASFAYTQGFPWYLAAVLGLLISSVWNFSVNSVFTWREQRQLKSAASLRVQRASAAAASTNGGEYHPASS